MSIFREGRSPIGILLIFIVAACVALRPAPQACCPVGRVGKPVVNADQTVIILWDAADKVQHFIRQASFKTDDADLGFLIPSPDVPELAESGDDAFPLLASYTAPEIKRVSRGAAGGCSVGCSAPMAPGAANRAATDDARPKVEVLAEKRVAGFDAKVLAADSADALTAWLKENDYDFSDAVKAWAAPYVEQGWKFTALKVAKSDATDDVSAKPAVSAGALRMSFKTDRPLFPYREPDSTASAESLGVKDRLLRIYLLAEARYAGAFDVADKPWSGETAHAGELSSDRRAMVLAKLGLPTETGPQAMWLTEFEDHWPYATAPSDLWFSPSEIASPIKRDPIIEYVQAKSGDGAAYLVAFALVVPWALRRRRSES